MIQCDDLVQALSMVTTQLFSLKNIVKKAMVKKSKRPGQNQSTRPLMDEAHLTLIEKDHLGDSSPEKDCC